MSKSDEGKTTSYWEAADNLIETEQVEGPVITDVCIIGGGIAGLTTAYRLGKQGRRVVVVDDGLIGGGETCRTTAHLSNALDDRIYRIEQWHGKEKTRLAVESHGRAIDEIEHIVTEEKIDCDFRRVDGYLIQAENGEDDIREELDAAHRSGLSEVELVDRAPMPDFDTGQCLRFPRQGQFHILKYLSGLVRAIERDGGKLFSHTRAMEWRGGDAPSVVTAGGKDIRCNKLVLATNYPLMSKMFAELPAYRTYAIGVEIPSDTIEPALFWDTADPYVYVRTQPQGDHHVLIVGGEDHRTGQANDGEERFQRLFKWAQERFPAARELKYKWSGQFLDTHDGLAFIGRYSDSEPNVFLITGDSGMGMTHGTIGGMLVTDLICDRENPWTAVYDPTRLATQSVSEAVPEIVSSTVPYVDWVTGGDVASEDDVKKGEGAVIRRGIKKIAVYRDIDGNVFKRSAVCTHMGCIVRFNTLEKTWDCPCHGSRFTTSGEPINSPAIKALEILD
jgi:glycine/D-amino acid oxidase-like deaminating enzyme/nitrite reductase/ring-hydroxylating ferredoxin subunit